MEENKLVAAVSLLVGVAIGVNWPKMKKYIPMAKDKVLEVYESAKETVSDAAKTMKEKIAP